MSNGNSQSSGRSAGGIGFLSALTIAFIILKLLGKISWSWVWVLAPTWIPIAFGLLIVLIVVIKHV